MLKFPISIAGHVKISQVMKLFSLFLFFFFLDWGVWRELKDITQFTSMGDITRLGLGCIGRGEELRGFAGYQIFTLNISCSF